MWLAANYASRAGTWTTCLAIEFGQMILCANGGKTSKIDIQLMHKTMVNQLLRIDNNSQGDHAAQVLVVETAVPAAVAEVVRMALHEVAAEAEMVEALLPEAEAAVEIVAHAIGLMRGTDFPCHNHNYSLFD